MTKMVRQQMICIVTPDWPGRTDLPESDPLYGALKGLFYDVGVVHFASIALLPPMTDAPGQLPSLMLELVVEEGLRPYDLLFRIVNHPGGAMWSLYREYWSRDEPQTASKRNQQLLDRLMSCHYIADGCFVGARDRSVQQIRLERELLEETRTEARALKTTHGKDRTSFALALTRWAFGNPRFEWATERAPRSYWRKSAANAVVYPAVIVGLGLALVWLMGAFARLLACAVRWLSKRSDTACQAVLDAVNDASWWVLGVSIRLLVALAVLVVVLVVFFVVLPALFAPWKRWLDNLNRELDRPSETWSSFSTYVGVWLVGVPLALAGIWHVLAYAFSPKLFQSTVALWMPADPGWKHLVVIAAAILVVLGLGALSLRLDRLLPGLSSWFYRPHKDDVHRAQQVHPSVEACEAELAVGTAHMISLTDMRSPNRWSAWWTRAVLRIVTLLGRVVFTEGRLGHAPGIHFGHWHIIDGGRRFLFCTNYDGNFGGYLDDFINGASIGTTLFWRWTELKRRVAAAKGQPDVAEPRAFPPTRFLAFRGVKCELKFKSYARDSMLPHLFRFDAYELSIDEINRATLLRDALFGARNDSNDDKIMRAIES